MMGKNVSPAKIKMISRYALEELKTLVATEYGSDWEDPYACGDVRETNEKYAAAMAERVNFLRLDKRYSVQGCSVRKIGKIARVAMFEYAGYKVSAEMNDNGGSMRIFGPDGNEIDNRFSPDDFYIGSSGKTGGAGTVMTINGTGIHKKSRVCGTCRLHCPGCYADRLFGRSPDSLALAAINTKILSENVQVGLAAIDRACGEKSYMRFNETGDFYSSQYAAGLIDIAKNRPNCTMWGYTKKYDLINALLSDREKPDNFTIILSCEFGGCPDEIPNPHRLPISRVFFGGDTIPAGVTMCAAQPAPLPGHKCSQGSTGVTCDACPICPGAGNNEVIGFWYH